MKTISNQIFHFISRIFSVLTVETFAFKYYKKAFAAIQTAFALTLVIVSSLWNSARQYQSFFRKLSFVFKEPDCTSLRKKNSRSPYLIYCLRLSFLISRKKTFFYIYSSPSLFEYFCHSSIVFRLICHCYEKRFLLWLKIIKNGFMFRKPVVNSHIVFLELKIVHSNERLEIKKKRANFQHQRKNL